MEKLNAPDAKKIEDRRSQSTIKDLIEGDIYKPLDQPWLPPRSLEAWRAHYNNPMAIDAGINDVDIQEKIRENPWAVQNELMKYLGEK